MIFTAEQVACVCEVLLQGGCVDRLAAFLDALPPLSPSTSSCCCPGELESVLKARAAVAFHQGRFSDLYGLLQGFRFSPGSQPLLQQLWLRALRGGREAEGPTPGGGGEVSREEEVPSALHHLGWRGDQLLLQGWGRKSSQ